MLFISGACVPLLICVRCWPVFVAFGLDCFSRPWLCPGRICDSLHLRCVLFLLRHFPTSSSLFSFGMSSLLWGARGCVFWSLGSVVRWALVESDGFLFRLLLDLWHVSCLVSPPWILVHFWSCSSCEGIQGLVSCTGIVHVYVVVCFLVWFVWFLCFGSFLGLGFWILCHFSFCVILGFGVFI